MACADIKRFMFRNHDSRSGRCLLSKRRKGRLPAKLVMLAAMFSPGLALAQATVGDVISGLPPKVLKPGQKRPAIEMNVLQASIGNLYINKNIQICVVLDATESMGQQIESAKSKAAEFVQRIERAIENETASQGNAGKVEMALVVYRDVKAPSGAVTKPVGTFTEDVGAIVQALQNVQPETGAPYFREKVAEGLRTAIDDLAWSNDKANWSRWILLVGDAPPYSDGDSDRSSRCSDGELLADLKDKEITVVSVYCQAGFKDQAFDAEDPGIKKEIAYAKEFFATLSRQTKGQFFDLSSEEVVNRLLAEVKTVRSGGGIHPPILETDIAQVKGESAGNKSVAVSANEVPIAVLPFLSKDNMSFITERDEVLVATAFRDKLKLIDQMRIADPVKVEKAFAAVGDVSADRDLVKKLGRQLQVDYLVWGDYGTTSDKTKVTARMYKCLDGSVVAEVTRETESSDADGATTIANFVNLRLLSQTYANLKMAGGVSDGELATFNSLNKNDTLAQEFVVAVSNDIRANRSLLMGLDYVEHALAYRKDSEQSKPALEQGRDALLTAVGLEPSNPYAQLLLANCYYNLARSDQADDDLKKCYSALEAAYSNKEKAPSEVVKTEIEADYALLVTRKYADAAQSYQKIVENGGKGRGNFALRAHWALAFIYLGDWGVKERDPSMINPGKAREHILQILAFWPGTPEYQYLAGLLNLKYSSAGETQTIPIGGSTL